MTAGAVLITGVLLGAVAVLGMLAAVVALRLRGDEWTH